MEWLTSSDSLNYWHWLSFGLLCIVAEMVLPGASLLWVGGAALATGITVWLFPDIDWRWQVIIFGILGIVAIAASRRLLTRRRSETMDSDINNRTASLIGHTATLDTAIENGLGRARIGDTGWIVTGPDLPAGAKVRIIGVDGAALQVEAAL